MNSHQYEAKVRKKVRKERPAPRSMGLTGTPIIIRWELEISMSSGSLCFAQKSTGRGCPNPGYVLQLHESSAPWKPLGFTVGTAGPEIWEKRLFAF